jgi:hypothetical protein
MVEDIITIKIRKFDLEKLSERTNQAISKG